MLVRVPDEMAKNPDCYKIVKGVGCVPAYDATKEEREAIKKYDETIRSWNGGVTYEFPEESDLRDLTEEDRERCKKLRKEIEECMSREMYMRNVIDEVRGSYPQVEFQRRFDEYVVTAEFQQDIANNFRDGVSVSACAYNLWMRI